MRGRDQEGRVFLSVALVHKATPSCVSVSVCAFVCREICNVAALYFMWQTANCQPSLSTLQLRSLLAVLVQDGSAPLPGTAKACLV